MTIAVVALLAMLAIAATRAATLRASLDPRLRTAPADQHVEDVQHDFVVTGSPQLVEPYGEPMQSRPNRFPVGAAIEQGDNGRTKRTNRVRIPERGIPLLAPVVH